ncbi:MAG: SGNH/GDSL hydrolase family protein [Proteobacteria bacterium]|nr:SGNH/GDSL hydrolase family protein [Pseudomonadota bacterium]
MAVRPIPLAAAALGVLVASVSVAWLGGGSLDGLGEHGGGITWQDDALRLEEGAWLRLGVGTQAEVTTPMAGRAFDLAHGSHEQPRQFTRIDGENISIHAGDGQMISALERYPRASEAPHTVVFSCKPPLTTVIDGANVVIAEPVKTGSESCPDAPLYLRAVTGLQVTGLAVDGVPLEVAPSLFEPVSGLVALAVGLVGLAALGPSALALLLLAPLAPLIEPFGIPGRAFIWMLFAAGCSMRILEGGWRRWAALALTLFALAAGGRELLISLTPDGLTAGSEQDAGVAEVVVVTMGIRAFENKVDEAVRFYGPSVRSPRSPLVVTFGSSSSGGNQPAGFWPDHLGRALPQAQVQTLAWGGATSWHMRSTLERLDIRPDVCVMYMGHNDTNLSVPGRSIAAIERGDAQTAEGFVAPVTLDEARDNAQALADRCDGLVIGGEYSVGREDDVNAWLAAVSQVEGVVVVDVSSVLKERPFDEMMVDAVHPSPEGQRRVAEVFAPAVESLLEQQVDER